jgi:hypothetical protein
VPNKYSRTHWKRKQNTPIKYKNLGNRERKKYADKCPEKFSPGAV